LNKQTIDRESVRVLAIELGAREAARRLGVKENTVLSWARRGAWALPKRNGQAQAAIKSAIKLQKRPGDVLLDHKGLEAKAKGGLSLAAANAAEYAGALSPDKVYASAPNFRSIASAAAAIFGWDTGQRQTMTFNTMVVDPETLSKIRELREA
jgi:hypothetical protein